jgi:hypothetical protein
LALEISGICFPAGLTVPLAETLIGHFDVQHD